MKNIKKGLLYFSGFLLSFYLNQKSVFAIEQDLGRDTPLYGVSNSSSSTIWEKTLSLILSPIFLVSVAVLAVVIGTTIYVKRKKKHAPEKDS